MQTVNIKASSLSSDIVCAVW